MHDTVNDSNLVESLRSRTEKTEIGQSLKRTLGGYTKNSVLEYLDTLRRQQLAAADTFSRNQQILFEEKENLKRDNEALKTRLGQVEFEYRNLSETLRSNALNSEEASPSDVVALKNKIAALEDVLSKAEADKSKLEQKIGHQSAAIDELTSKLDQAAKERAALKEMTKAEMMETKKERETVAKFRASLEERDEEIKFLNSLVATGQVAKLTAKINDLMQQLDAQSDVLASVNSETEIKTKTIATLTDENEALRANIENLTSSLGAYSDQNDRLLFANKSLTDQLEAEYKRSISLVKEKSGITVDKLTAVKKLDEACAKITLLELQVQKLSGIKEMTEIYQSAEKTEETKSVIS